MKFKFVLQIKVHERNADTSTRKLKQKRKQK